MKLDQLLKMVNLITYCLGELRFLFEAVRVPSIGLTGGFDVLEKPVELLEVGLNNNDPVIKTAGKKLCDTFVHDANVQNKYL